MKLSRWLVIAMLTTSALSVLAAAGWCWVTWPERTGGEFTHLISEGEYEQARQMIRFKPNANVTILMVNERLRTKWTQSSLGSEPRTVGDLIRARQVFLITGQPVS